MLKIGLTGGIGCGKSTVAALFAQLNVPVIDADVIAHELVQKGQPALAEIAQAFGAEILHPDGTLDRARLRERIFTDAQAKQTLEALLHPLIYHAIQAAAGLLSAPYCIICVPLLFETGMTALVGRILVVDCPPETQIKRVRLRDPLSAERIQSIMDSQVSRAFRIAHADDVIDNTQTDDKLAEQVKKLHNLYLSISHCQD
jgi:dephospho-CoA kinase